MDPDFFSKIRSDVDTMFYEERQRILDIIELRHKINVDPEEHDFVVTAGKNRIGWPSVNINFTEYSLWFTVTTYSGKTFDIDSNYGSVYDSVLGANMKNFYLMGRFFGAIRVIEDSIAE